MSRLRLIFKNRITERDMKFRATLLGIVLFALSNQAHSYYIVYDGEPKLPHLDCQDFEELVLTSTLFIDKTLLIEEFLNCTNSTQTEMIIRPPGWGKTVNMDMMRRYFELQLDHNGYPRRPQVNPNKKLFFGGKIEHEGRRKRFNTLKISANKNLAEKYFGKHPVIVLKLGQVYGRTYRHLFHNWFGSKIRHLFQNEYGFLRKYTEDNDAPVSPYLRERLARYYADDRLSVDELEMSLNTLVRVLHHHLNGTTAFVFIDQYDDPFVYGFENYGWNEYQKFYEIIMNFFWNTFELAESRRCIEKGLLTGVYPMILNTNITALRDPSIYTIMNMDVHSMMMNPQKYSPYYGFYENEVKLMMRKTETTMPHHLLKQWYNGFNYTKYYIYNPISTIECIRTSKLATYWYNSTRLKLLERTNDCFIIQLMLLMIVQGRFTTTVYTFLNYEDFGRPHGKVSALLHAGLFTVTENERLEFADSGTETLMLPNIENTLILQRYTVAWTCMLYQLNESLLYSLIKKYRQPFTEALINFRENEFRTLLQEYLESFPVSVDNSREAQQFYIWVLLYLFICDDRSGHYIKRYKYDFNYDTGPAASEIAIVQAPLKLNQSCILLLRTDDYVHNYELIIELKFVFKYIKTLAVHEVVFYGRNKAQVMTRLEQQRKKGDKFRWSNLTFPTITNLTIVRKRLLSTAPPTPDVELTNGEDFDSLDDYDTAFPTTDADDDIDIVNDKMIALKTKWQTVYFKKIQIGPPKKKLKIVLKWHQLRELEKAYNITKYPDKPLIDELRQKLNVTEKIIQTWFTQERKREKYPGT